MKSARTTRENNANPRLDSIGPDSFFRLLISVPLWSKPFKALVVMGCERDNPWCVEIKSGIDSALGQCADRHYFLMNTTMELPAEPETANKTFSILENLQPGGVLNTDGNARSLFVLTYWKDRGSTPVMFCGVNDEAEVFGYPSSHVSGTLARGAVRESIGLANQLIPDFDRLCIVARKSPSGPGLSRCAVRPWSKASRERA